MGRNILAVVLALIAGNIAIMVIHFLGTAIYPLPDWVDPMDPESLAQYIPQAPLGALLIVMLAHLTGPFIGGLLIGKIALSHHTKLALLVGVLFLAFGVMNMMQMPHPKWFYVELLGYVPVALLGLRVVRRGHDPK